MMRRISSGLCSVCGWMGLAVATAAESLVFESQVLDPDIGKVCYAVTTADVNSDGRLDIVAVSENRVQWYEAPKWTKHVILEDQTERDNVAIAVHDIDGDGRIDFALAAGWTKIGTVQWLSRGAQPNDRWNVHYVTQEIWLHRMTFADVLGKGKPQLVVSPLNKTVAEGVRLMAFEIPTNPRTERWLPTILDQSLNRMHNHTHLRWDTGDALDTLTASEEGVYIIARNAAGEFAKTRIGTGAVAEQPIDRGAGEIRYGLMADGRRFLATVEPMHGNAVVVYLPPAAGELWQRVVLDDTLRQGHAVAVANLDGLPGDEIVIGHREPGPGPVTGPGVYVYRAATPDGTSWTKHVIDNGGVAVEDLVVADFDGDGRVDIVAGGRATHNLKLYWNRTPQPQR